MNPSDWSDEHAALVVVGARVVENCPPSSPYCQTDRAYGEIVEVSDGEVGVCWDHRHRLARLPGCVCSRYDFDKVYSRGRRSGTHGVRVTTASQDPQHAPGGGGR